jgi:hypothetical protein
MSFAGAYLDKVSLDPRIEGQHPSPNLNLVVAIPVSNEPGLLATLESLRSCTLPKADVEVIVAFNSSASAGDDVLVQNRKSLVEIHDFDRRCSNHNFRILCTEHAGIPDKVSGAGFARKIAMDHALSRFNRLNRPRGIILSLDADTICERRYFTEIEKHFLAQPESRACSIYFEHPVRGHDYPPIVYTGITQYELHIRYYIEGLRYAGHPHAYHTVGSAFAVRAEEYSRQGGMNRKKAGEDFYFLQKIIPLGNFHEVNSTCVCPSPRPSDRVAFGTGPVIRQFLEGRVDHLHTYNPRIFKDLKQFLSDVSFLYLANEATLHSIHNSWPETIRNFLGSGFFDRLGEIRQNSAREETFTKRFFRWFNMFRTLKFMNQAHRETLEKLPVVNASRKLLADCLGDTSGEENAEALLLYLRKRQRTEYGKI